MRPFPPADPSLSKWITTEPARARVVARKVEKEVEASMGALFEKLVTLVTTVLKA